MNNGVGSAPSITHYNSNHPSFNGLKNRYSDLSFYRMDDRDYFVSDDLFKDSKIRGKSSLMEFKINYENNQDDFLILLRPYYDYLLDNSKTEYIKIFSGLFFPKINCEKISAHNKPNKFKFYIYDYKNMFKQNGFNKVINWNHSIFDGKSMTIIKDKYKKEELDIKDIIDPLGVLDKYILLL